MHLLRNAACLQQVDKIKSFLINCGIFACMTRATSITFPKQFPPGKCSSLSFTQADESGSKTQGLPMKAEILPARYDVWAWIWLILLPWIDLCQQLWLHSLIWGEYYKPRQIVSTVTCWDSMTRSVGLVTVRPKSVTTDQESGVVYLETHPEAIYNWGISLIVYICITSIGTS